MTPKAIEQTRIFTRSEIAKTITTLKRNGKRAVNARQNLIIFRLATCCGLRVSEIVGLNLANVVTGSQRPHIYVPKEIAKRNKARKVPLWWDGATLADLDQWKRERVGQGAKAGDSFVCSQATSTKGKALITRNAQNRFKLAIKCLGKERVQMLSIHCGRHSFCSHSLAGGRTLPEVRDAAGHANISTTSIYLHSIHDDGDVVGNLFDF